VCAISVGGTVWLQHDDAKIVVAGSAERIVAGPGAGLSAPVGGAQADGADGAMVVAVGLGRFAGVSTGHSRAGAGLDPSPVQQIHAFAGRQFAGPVAAVGGEDPVSRQKHSG